MIELTEPIRQQNDLEYYNNILQPLRKGVFHLDQSNFQKQIDILKKRVIQLNSIGPTPKIKQELDQKFKNKEQIIYLFFKNENVEFENYKRAKKILDEFQLDNYYLLLPIGIRNFVAKLLGRKTHAFAVKNEQFNKTTAQVEITLFKNAEVVIRRNIDKTRQIINGQFAKIVEMNFDIDYQSIKTMRQFIVNKNDYIKENNYYDIYGSVKEQKKYTFSKQIFEEICQIGSQRLINNINFLMEKDVSQEEKISLYENRIMPRLSQIKLNIEQIGIQDLNLYQKKFIQKININKSELVSEIQIVIEQVELTLQQLTFCSGKPIKQRQESFYKFLKNNNLIKLFYIDIVTSRFGLNYLKDTLFNLRKLCKNNSHFSSTIQNVVIDLDMTEQQQHGLLYTAMSRARNIQNLFFSGKFESDKFMIKVNENIDDFFQKHFVVCEKFFQDQYLKKLLNDEFDEVWKNLLTQAQVIRQKAMNYKK
ncbi:unnamed protein product [Paramecium sonneborni]|uniref:Uncharacterized protein n=1 Tax=Paramecium sonneborni TaxID=65129 RepID=A0A8S1RR89_9CILI|nr:unnamed protein product [Paramecium sonneborni]